MQTARWSSMPGDLFSVSGASDEYTLTPMSRIQGTRFRRLYVSPSSRLGDSDKAYQNIASSTTNAIEIS